MGIIDFFNILLFGHQLFSINRLIVCLFSDKFNDHLITNLINYIKNLFNASTVINIKNIAVNKLVIFVFFKINLI